MAFSEIVVEAAWHRSGGRCECRNGRCGHFVWGCNKPLDRNARGDDFSAGGWEAHHVVPLKEGGKDTLSNCQILCIPCHKATPSYGG